MPADLWVSTALLPAVMPGGGPGHPFEPGHGLAPRQMDRIDCRVTTQGGRARGQLSLAWDRPVLSRSGARKGEL